MENWFGRWDATQLLHDTSLDSSVNEVFLQSQCIARWKKCGDPHFTHYTTYIAPNLAIRTVAFMQLSSHALRCEMVHK